MLAGGPYLKLQKCCHAVFWLEQQELVQGRLEEDGTLLARAPTPQSRGLQGYRRAHRRLAAAGGASTCQTTGTGPMSGACLGCGTPAHINSMQGNASVGSSVLGLRPKNLKSYTLNPLECYRWTDLWGMASLFCVQLSGQ